MAGSGLCSDCGAVRGPGYENDSRCYSCRSKINKEKRAKTRAENGQKKWGSGRSIYCTKCKKEKEPGRDNESNCKTCKSEAGKARRAKKRLEMGLRPLGSGRQPECYDCGAITENPKEGYCCKCKNKRSQEYRLASGITKRQQTGLCRCGNERASYSNCYCSPCASAWRKGYLQEHPDKAEKLYKRANERRFESLDEYIKYVARYTANNAIKVGWLIRENCEVCGTDESVEAHHDDYMRPLDVRWLCRVHHAEHHRMKD